MGSCLGSDFLYTLCWWRINPYNEDILKTLGTLIPCKIRPLFLLSSSSNIIPIFRWKRLKFLFACLQCWQLNPELPVTAGQMPAHWTRSLVCPNFGPCIYANKNVIVTGFCHWYIGHSSKSCPAWRENPGKHVCSVFICLCHGGFGKNLAEQGGLLPNVAVFQNWPF